MALRPPAQAVKLGAGPPALPGAVMNCSLPRPGRSLLPPSTPSVHQPPPSASALPWLLSSTGVGVFTTPGAREGAGREICKINRQVPRPLSASSLPPALCLPLPLSGRDHYILMRNEQSHERIPETGSVRSLSPGLSGCSWGQHSAPSPQPQPCPQA